MQSAEVSSRSRAVIELRDMRLTLLFPMLTAMLLLLLSLAHVKVIFSLSTKMRQSLTKKTSDRVFPSGLLLLFHRAVVSSAHDAPLQ